MEVKGVEAKDASKPVKADFIRDVDAAIAAAREPFDTDLLRAGILAMRSPEDIHAFITSRRPQSGFKLKWVRKYLWEWERERTAWYEANRPVVAEYRARFLSNGAAPDEGTEKPADDDAYAPTTGLECH